MSQFFRPEGRALTAPPGAHSLSFLCAGWMSSSVNLMKFRGQGTWSCHLCQVRSNLLLSYCSLHMQFWSILSSLLAVYIAPVLLKANNESGCLGSMVLCLFGIEMFVAENSLQTPAFDTVNTPQNCITLCLETCQTPQLEGGLCDFSVWAAAFNDQYNDSYFLTALHLTCH